jgi:hypothetical protein
MLEVLHGHKSHHSQSKTEQSDGVKSNRNCKSKTQKGEKKASLPLGIDTTAWLSN